MLIRGGGGSPGMVESAQGLTLSCHTTARHAVVEMAGSLDSAAGDQVYRYLADVIGKHRLPVIVGVSRVTYCDSDGVLALARSAERAGLSGCELWLRGRALPVIRIMRVSGSGWARLRWKGRCTLAWTDPAAVVARLAARDWPSTWPPAQP